MAFTFHHELGRFLQTMFVFKIVPTTFQRFVDIVPLTVECKLDIVYFEDFFTSPRSIRKHLYHVQTFLYPLFGASCAQKMKRIFFFNNSVNYLRPIFQHARLEFHTNKTILLRLYSMQPFLLFARLSKSFTMCMDDL